MKNRSSIIAAALLAVIPAFSARAVNTMADIVVVVDESGSMSGEHAWLGGMIANLSTNLTAAGVTDTRFALVGFGNSAVVPRTLTDFTDVAGFQVADNGLVINGGTEDGWAGINHALNTLSWRNGAAANVILVTDEDRDNTNAALTYASILAALNSRGALLNVVVDNAFSVGGVGALGVDSKGNGYTANGSGGFNQGVGVVGAGAGTTTANYVDMALATGGAAWDLDFLRSGGLNATSFTAAFTAIKVQEISTQPPQGTPDAGSTMVLFVSGLLTIVALRRRMMA